MNKEKIMVHKTAGTEIEVLHSTNYMGLAGFNVYSLTDQRNMFVKQEDMKNWDFKYPEVD